VEKSTIKANPKKKKRRRKKKEGSEERSHSREKKNPIRGSEKEQKLITGKKKCAFWGTPRKFRKKCP